VEISNGTMGDENPTMFQGKTWLHGLLFYVNFHMIYLIKNYHTDFGKTFDQMSACIGLMFGNFHFFVRTIVPIFGASFENCPGSSFF
jgi:hypothetical protein